MVQKSDDIPRSVPARIGMWMGGDVIMPERLLLEAGATDVRSVVLRGHSDHAIEQALSECADFEIVNP